MQVIRAEAMGMCFGVKDALALARALPNARSTTIYGELVHNEVVRDELETLGFRQVSEPDRKPELTTEQVLVTAHGISDSERAALRARGHVLVDTTCPLVRRAHRAALDLADDGYHVIVLGRKGHVEVRGLVGDLESFSVLESVADVRTFAHAKLGVVCQTTLPEERALQMLAVIRRANPHADILFRDTVCEPTKERQRAMHALLGSVDAVVVVGGCNSNNTKQLVLASEAAGLPAFHVQGPDDLDLARLRDFDRVGLTAGTSTPDETIDAVEAALLRAVEPCTQETRS